MNVKKIIEIIEAEPNRANDPAGLLIYLNMKGSKKLTDVRRPTVIGRIKLGKSIADEHGGDAILEEVEAAIAYKEKKGPKIK